MMSLKEDCSNGIQKGRITQLLNIKGGLNTKKISLFILSSLMVCTNHTYYITRKEF